MDHADTDEIELEIDVDDRTGDAPAVEVGSDPAAEAFARLAGEMALMRRAVEHLAAERADIVIPDYGATLTEMTKRVGAISGSIKAMSEQPAMQLTPDSLSRRIDAVSESARRDDQRMINQAQAELRQAAQEMRGVTTQARTTQAQRRSLAQAVAGGALAGMLLWSFLPGTIARAMPETWHWPERMARHVLGGPSLIDAGVRMIRADSPATWDALANAAKLSEVNADAIERCKGKALKAKQPVECTIRVVG